MKRKWLGAVVLAAAGVAACGEGRAIFNVDMLSFLQPLGEDVIPYDVPGGVGPVDSTISQPFSLPPGFGKSSVDSVSVTGAATLENTGGGGTITVDVFFAKTQAALFTGTPYASASSGHVTGANTVPFLFPTTVTLNDTLFNTSSLWIGLRASITTDPPLATHMTGQVRLTQLSARIVLSEKIF